MQQIKRSSQKTTIIAGIYKVILLSFLLCLSTSNFAQTKTTLQTVRGTVVDAFTGNPIEGATVVIINSKPIKIATTDLRGEFAIPDVAPGRWSFVASIVGYKQQVISNEMVISGKESSLNFKLEEKVNSLKEIIVSNSISKEKPLNETALISARSFSVEETERFAGSLGDPARMVSGFAGVATGNDSRNDIIIRGNSPMELLWRIEGVEISNPNHFGAQGSTGGPVSMLNSNLLTNSDFMTGAFPAEFGNALSGVFDLNVRSGNKNKYEFTGQVAFNGFEVAAEGPIRLSKNAPTGSFLIDYRYSTLQLLSNLGINLGTGTGSAIPQYNDLTVIVDLPTKKTGRFKLFGLMGNSFIRLNRSFDITEATAHSQVGYATDFGASLGAGILTHTLMLSDKTRLKSSISYQQSGSNTINDTIDYMNKSYFTNYAGILNEKKEIISTNLRHKFNSSDFIFGGISANRYSTSFGDSAWVKAQNRYITLTDVHKSPSLLYQAFANWQHKFNDQFAINSGVHYQYYDLSNENLLEPRLSMEWRLNDKNRFSAGYGLHSQIQPRSVYFYKQYHPNTNSYTQDNTNLRSTRSHQAVVGYDWFSGKDFHVKSELYYQYLFNVPVSSIIGQYSLLNAGSGYFIERLDSLKNTGKGKNYGMELTVEKFLNNGYYMLLTLSVYDSKYQGNDGAWRNTAFNSNFAANLLTGYEWKIGKNNFLTADIKATWSGGMRYIPIDLNASIAAGEQVFDYAGAYDKKYQDYFRTDLRIGYKTNKGRISQEWGINLQNLTNHNNLFAEQYNNQLKSVEAVYQQGFLPMFLYRINF